MFTFGYGLSYTQFEYSDLHIEQVKAMSFLHGDVRERESMADTLCIVTFNVKNIGPCDGEEVVQLYVRDEVASVAPASKLLKGFQRVHINKGETVEVSFYLIPRRDLSVYSKEKGWHVEPGEFTIMVGGSSENVVLSSSLEVK